MKTRWQREMKAAAYEVGLILMGIFLWLLLAIFARGQEIVGPDETGVSQPAWFTLDLGDFKAGRFDSGSPDFTLDTDPNHVAINAAMFYSTAPGSFRIVAALASEDGQIEFVDHVITVTGEGGGGDNPQPDLRITEANVAKWLALVPEAARTEEFTHPIRGKKMTRQQAVSETFTNIGQAGTQIKSVPGMDDMLSASLVSALGANAEAWQPFADKIDAALAELKAKKVSYQDYAKAFLTIGRALQ